jgi:MYXO-CTERM domain-containing protein
MRGQLSEAQVLGAKHPEQGRRENVRKILNGISTTLVLSGVLCTAANEYHITNGESASLMGDVLDVNTKYTSGMGDNWPKVSVVNQENPSELRNPEDTREQLATTLNTFNGMAGGIGLTLLGLAGLTAARRRK